jgi:hypothetical protein
VNKVKKLVVPMLTPEAAIIWTGLLVIAIMVLAFYMGGAGLRAQMRNSFGELSAPIRIAIFGGVSVTLWVLAFTVVSRIAARLHYAFDPGCSSSVSVIVSE